MDGGKDDSICSPCSLSLNYTRPFSSLLSTSFGRDDDWRRLNAGHTARRATRKLVHIVHIATDVAITATSQRDEGSLLRGNLPCASAASVTFSRIYKRSPEYRGYQDIARLPTACFFLMCTFGVMRWRESERVRKREREKVSLLKSLPVYPPSLPRYNPAPLIPHLVRVPISRTFLLQSRQIYPGNIFTF